MHWTALPVMLRTAFAFVTAVVAAGCAHAISDSSGQGGDLIGLGPTGSPKPQACDDAGNCICVRIASLGKAGHYGAGGGDNTAVFTDWLNAKSTAAVDLYTSHPTLTPDFLAKYDVLIVQWLTDSNSGPYWSFSGDEIGRLKNWVNAGGGLITLSGYDTNPQEVVPLNQLLSFTDISYNMDDVLGICPPADNCYCWGNSVPLGPWADGPIGKNITQVGAYHGRSINPGGASVDCSDASYTYAVHEAIGKGHVIAYTDEWVTYSSQWLGTSPNNNSSIYTNPSDPCFDKSAASVFQVPQFWYNLIRWASSVSCSFTIRDPGIAR